MSEVIFANQRLHSFLIFYKQPPLFVYDLSFIHLKMAFRDYFWTDNFPVNEHRWFCDFSLQSI